MTCDGCRKKKLKEIAYFKKWTWKCIFGKHTYNDNLCSHEEGWDRCIYCGYEYCPL